MAGAERGDARACQVHDGIDPRGHGFRRKIGRGDACRVYHHHARYAAAACAQHFAVQVAIGVQQPGGHWRDPFRCHMRAQMIQRSRWQGFGHAGHFDHARIGSGRYGVHQHPRIRPFQRQIAGEGIKRALGGGVMGHVARSRDGTGQRVDDPACAGLDQMRPGRLAHHHRAHEMHIHMRAIGGDGGIGKPAHADDARVVHQPVNPAKPGKGAIHDALDITFAGDIRRDGQRRAPLCANGAGQFFAWGGIHPLPVRIAGRIRKNDRSAACGQQFGMSTPYAARRPGDDDRPAGKIQHGPVRYYTAGAGPVPASAAGRCGWWRTW